MRKTSKRYSQGKCERISENADYLWIMDFDNIGIKQKNNAYKPLQKSALTTSCVIVFRKDEDADISDTKTNTSSSIQKLTDIRN
jgi:hypothetical protein